MFAFDPQAPLDAEFVELFRADASDDADWSGTVLPPASSSADFVAQADAMGRDGFSYRGDFSFGDGSIVSLYDRRDGDAARPTYEAVAPAEGEEAALLQLNAQGARGYRTLGSLFFEDDGIRALYVRDAAGDDVYDYRSLPAATSPDAFLEQANSEGAAGYRYAGDVAYAPTPPFASLFVRDASSSGIYAYELAVPAGESADAFVRQAARFGDEGKLWIGDRTFDGTDPSAFRSVYVDLTQCDCEPQAGPFGL